MDEITIKVQNLSKIYKLYDKPIDRMKEALSISKKRYGKDHYALHNISFEVQKGETVGIIGRNGSGKSTLLKIITGVLTQSTGNVVVNGKVSALLELGAGFNPEYTGIENVYLNGTMMGYSKEEMDKRVEPIIQFADIGEFINQPVKTYSSGMFARLAFAVAVNVEPEILIVDEALSVGDMRFQIKCMDKMKEMMQGGATVLFVSHDTNAIRRFCTRAIWLDNGIIREDGDVNRICDEYMDYLKFGEEYKKIKDNLEKGTMNKSASDFITKDSIAEIVSFEIRDEMGEEIKEVGIEQKIEMIVTYDVYDETMEEPVLGIAVKSVDDDYICGLNTLLDNKKIPWEYGRNQFRLEYTYGIRTLGGKYYFDVAIFDKTATVPIQYKSMIKTIRVYGEYIGEGRYIIPHKWKGYENDKI